ncbi:hypothetical protein AURDEDRAFT_162117 [Auricularia subglabra TFB-10046 SS5]|nr:hypothetical protein AURDEDRAFT_162117 [Auricularia subglabra TFB-10046 SS5]
MATFPMELLSMIFGFANTQNDAQVQSDDRRLHPRHADRDRVALPWRLGLVCRHWREAVLASPGAWSYIAVSYKLNPVFRVGARVPYSTPLPLLETCVENSGSVPLDVVMCSEGPDGGGDRRGQDLADEDNFFRPRFELLLEHVHRIRSLHAVGMTLLPDPRHRYAFVTMYHGLIDLLRAPMASLVELRIHMYRRGRVPTDPGDFWHGFPAQPIPLLLPAAPKLRELSVEGAPVVCRRPHSGLPSLNTLLYRLDNMHEVHLHDMLAISPNLERLSLEVKNVLHDANPSPRAAAQVKILEVPRRGQYFDLLADGARLLPNLSHLLLHDFSALSVTPALARRLTRLDITEQEDLHEHVGILRQLGCIERADFGENVTMRDDLFFAPFCEPRDPMWPKLRVITFSGAEMLSVDKDGVLRLLRARNLDAEGERVARPIEEINLDSGCLPEWVAIQVRAILPPADSSGV